jgi:cell shape-determining protein MreD
MNWLNPTLILLTAFVAVFLEAACGAPRQLLGAQIDILPALMVYTALTSSFGMVTALAVLGGLWFDSLSANPLGVTILPLYLAGLLIHTRRGLILRSQTYAQFVLGLFASAMVPALTVLLLLSMGRSPLLGWGSLWQWIVMSMGGGVLTPVCFRLFDGLERALTYRPVNENSFRPDRQIRRGRS